MTVTDPVADLLTRIRNANSAKHDFVEVPASKLNMEILNILQGEGFIKNFESIQDRQFPTVKVALKYGPKQEMILSNLKRISKPGLRVYAKHKKVPRVLRGLGVAIISTSRGVMTDREARKLGIGGEVLCHVW
ncbi:MAG: 30S ribosomal protein S8 [Armatimonadetes bacterium]|jgi:small subunit ribosomal protein S8|nr:30S ribosomal protein S8 [Armatimonadota bacterium]